MEKSDEKNTPVNKNILRNITLLVVTIVLCGIVAELSARFYWRFEKNVPFRDPGKILYAFYPEIREVDWKQPRHNDEFFDVLLLGGSVLNDDWGNVAQEIREQLAEQHRYNVRVFNLGVPAHTTRDSWLKYQALGDAEFELVIVYHGVNDARANSIPPQLYDDNYNHFVWYNNVNTMSKYHRAVNASLPYTLHYMYLQMKHVFAVDRMVSTNVPRSDWLQYGSESLTREAFKNNIQGIIEIARARGDRVMLMSFSMYVPPDYTLDKFRRKELDYRLHLSPLELWGIPENVRSTVRVHNDAIDDLVGENDDLLFVDQSRLMDGSANSYNDPYHLTAKGSRLFVSHIVDVLMQDLFPAHKDRVAQ